jgi:hypothetical protein
MQEWAALFPHSGRRAITPTTEQIPLPVMLAAAIHLGKYGLSAQLKVGRAIAPPSRFSIKTLVAPRLVQPLAWMTAKAPAVEIQFSRALGFT